MELIEWKLLWVSWEQLSGLALSLGCSLQDPDVVPEGLWITQSQAGCELKELQKLLFCNTQEDARKCEGVN